MNAAASRATARPAKVQIEAIQAGIVKFEAVTDTIKTAIKYACFVSCLWVILKGVADIGQLHAGSLKALGEFIRGFRLYAIVSYLGTAIFGIAWKIERRGKKRAIEKLGELRKQNEAGDHYRSSSGLKPNGNTPEE